MLYNRIIWTVSIVVTLVKFNTFIRHTVYLSNTKRLFKTTQRDDYANLCM